MSDQPKSERIEGRKSEGGGASARLGMDGKVSLKALGPESQVATPPSDRKPTQREPLDVAAIRKRAEAATAGPWKSIMLHDEARIDAGGVCVCVEPKFGAQPKDFHFIAHARTDVPALLDALEAAEIERDSFARLHEGAQEDWRRVSDENARLRAAGGWRLLEHTKGSHDEKRDPDCFPCAQAAHEERLGALLAAGNAMAKAMDDKLEALEAAGDALAMRCGGWAWPELVAWRKARDKEELSLAEEMLKDAHPGVDD